MLLRNKNLILFLLFLIPLCTWGQVKSIGLPYIKNYLRSEYKGGTQNWAIDQDANGNLYFANNDGLFQFDGTAWRTYRMKNSESIRSLKIDSQGKIYVGGYNEFGYFKANATGQLIYYSLTHLLAKNKAKDFEFIWKIHLFNGGVVFQSFTTAFYYKHNTIKIIKAPKRFQFSFLVGGKLYFQDLEHGILEYRNTKFYKLAGTKALNTTEIWNIVALPDQTLLITTLNQGLYTYSHSRLTTWNTAVNTLIKQYNSLGSLLIKDQFLLFNTVLNGVIVCDLKGKILQHINHKKGLQNNTVLVSFLDQSKNVWLGLDNGITYLNINSPFTFFGFSFDISTVYTSVIHDQKLYVATNRGVFYHQWSANFEEDSFHLIAGTTSQCWNIQVLDDEILCGNNNGALVLKGGQVSQVLDRRGYFGFKKIPGKERYLVGANYNGFALFENKGGQWVFRHQIAGFDHSSSNFEIDEHFIWFKKDNFLYQMSLSADMKKFDFVKKIAALSKHLPGIGSLQTINKRVYFQTQNRFFRYSQDQDLFFEDQSMSQKFKRLPLLNVINEDALGNIWYTFDKGLGMFEKVNSTYVNKLAPFSSLNGNLVKNFLPITSLDKNNIFIGLTNGLAHYSNKQVTNYDATPKVFLRNFNFQKDSLLLGNPSFQAAPLSLPYSSNHLLFTFSSPSYDNLANIEFSYQLEGFDKKWSTWSKSYVKEYTNLSEGDYIIRVKARNNFSIQSKEVSFPFTIRPPWYRHIIAYLFYLLILFFLARYIQKIVKANIRKNKYLETLEQRRLYLEKETKILHDQYLLEKEIEKLQNEKLKIKILAKDKELVNNSLQVVRKNKILNGIIQKLKEFNHEQMDETLKTQLTKLQRSVAKEVHADKSWNHLEKHIQNVHFEFLKRLKEACPTITPREMDLATYLLMNMSTKEISEIMNISTGGVDLARYRLRKKLNLTKKESLTGYLLKI